MTRSGLVKSLMKNETTKVLGEVESLDPGCLEKKKEEEGAFDQIPEEVLAYDYLREQSSR